MCQAQYRSCLQTVEDYGRIGTVRVTSITVTWFLIAGLAGSIPNGGRVQCTAGDHSLAVVTRKS
jgi:hypothetical protein